MGRAPAGARPAAIETPFVSQRLGIRMVHRHVSLVPHLKVTENILLGDMPKGRLKSWIDWPAAHRRAREILLDLGFKGIEVRKMVSQLSTSSGARDYEGECRALLRSGFHLLTWLEDTGKKQRDFG